MPARPGKRRIEGALRALRRALDATGAPWMIIGGIAVITRGVRRLTGDIDAVIRGDAVQVPALLAMLARHEIRPRIPHAAAFARENLVLLVRHDPTGVDLDLSLGWSGFELEGLGARETLRYGAVAAPMATAEDLVVFKAVASRPKDVEDAAALLLMYPAIDLNRVRRRLRELAELAEAPELVRGLEEIIARARRST